MSTQHANLINCTYIGTRNQGFKGVMVEWDVIGVVGEVFMQVSVLYNKITKYQKNK